MTGFITDNKYSAMAAADLTNFHYRFGLVDANGLIALPTVLGQPCSGVITVGEPSTGLRKSELQLDRVAPIVWGGTVAIGDKIVAEAATGRGVVQTVHGQTVMGLALSAGAVDQTGLVMLRPAPGGALSGPHHFSFDLASLAVNGNRIIDYLFGARGRIVRIAALVTTAGTGAGATVTLTPQINGVNLTGGVLTLTLAGTATIGTMIEATAITANNVFDEAGLFRLVASASTAFTAGRVDIFVFTA